MSDNQHTDATEHLGGAVEVEPVAAKLVVIDGPDEGRELPLDDVAVVGKDPDAANLVLTDGAVSREHARFELNGHMVRIRDLDSKNGTFVDDVRIVTVELPLGAVVRVGRSAIAVQSRIRTVEVEPSSSSRFGELVGRSVAIRQMFAVLERIAPADITVLVEGESGTGKELVARSLHRASSRAHGPLVVFDCSAVSAELIESELFGHVKGAFTGATADRNGAFLEADGGTLFLDEVGELPLELQPKLLRALESGDVKPVGAETSRRVDVRVVAATNRDLLAEAKRERFRLDLLYRLNVVKVRVPPLRHRPEDIPLLVQRLGENVLPADDRIEGPNLTALLNYGWPGNVRELRNVLRRAFAFCDEPVRFQKLELDLGPNPSGPASIGMEFPGVAAPMPYKDAKAQLLASFERAYVEALMERHDDNVSAAAESAGLSRKHLYSLLRRSDEDAED